MDGIFAAVELWLAGLGPWALVAAPLVMAAVAVLPLPAEAPAMVNGMLFGPVLGSGVTWLGAFLGAWVSFEIARAWGRPVAERMVPVDRLERVDRVADGAGWTGLLVARFVPVIAFTALNWGAGLCNVPRARFLWTTALGILPGAVLFTSTGVGLEALWHRSPALATGVVGVATVALGWWMVRRRRVVPAGGG